MSTWHAEGELLERYASGAIDPAHAASVETHLAACERCRGLFAEVTAEPEGLDASWATIVDALERPRKGLVERALLGLRVPGHWARLLAASPALRVSWLLSVAALVSLSLVAGHVGSDDPSLFLLLAPIVPLAGVATAFGPGVDPTYEICVAAPIAGFRLLLLRAAGVLGTSVPLLIAASLALPSVGWTAVAWLLPMAALVAGSLALATRVPPARACTAVTVVWLIVVGWSAYGGSGPTIASRCVAFSPSGQLMALVVAAAAAAIAAHRATSVDATVYAT